MAAAACILDVASLINYRCAPSPAVAAEVHRPPGHYHGTDGSVSDELRDRRRQRRAGYLISIHLLSPGRPFLSSPYQARQCRRRRRCRRRLSI